MRLSFAAIFLSFSVFLAICARAQTNPGPTLQSALSFIEKKTLEQGAVTVYPNDDPSIPSIPTNIVSIGSTDQVLSLRGNESDCTITWSDRTVLLPNSTFSGAYFDWQIHVRLKDIRTIQLRPNGPTGKVLVMNTPANSNSIVARLTATSSAAANAGKVIYKSNADLYFNDEDTATRVARAFVRAVELCGGGDTDEF
jgi:hypothetical protein